MNKGTLSELLVFKNGKKRPDSSGEYPVYGGNGILGYVDDYNYENCIIIGRVGAYCGSVFYEKGKCWVSDNAIVALPLSDVNIEYAYYQLKTLHLTERSIGTGQPLLTQDILKRVECYLTSINLQKSIATVLRIIDEKISNNIEINKNLSLLVA